MELCNFHGLLQTADQTLTLNVYFFLSREYLLRFRFHYRKKRNFSASLYIKTAHISAHGYSTDSVDT